MDLNENDFYIILTCLNIFIYYSIAPFILFALFINLSNIIEHSQVLNQYELLYKFDVKNQDL
jgi:hypothetical protein